VTAVQALDVLALDAPKIAGTSQEDIDAKLAVWKTEVLKPARNAALQAVHPDVPGGSGEETKRVLAAYAKLASVGIQFNAQQRAAAERLQRARGANQRSRAIHPPPTPEHARSDNAATYCPQCGTKRFVVNPARREYGQFCWNCGLNFLLSPMERTMLAAGLTQPTIDWAKSSGTYAELAKAVPLSPAWNAAIKRLRVVQAMRERPPRRGFQGWSDD